MRWTDGACFTLLLMTTVMLMMQPVFRMTQRTGSGVVHSTVSAQMTPVSVRRLSSLVVMLLLLLV